MAKAIETLKIAIDFQDKGSQAVIEKLKNSLHQLERGASGAKPRVASLRKEILAQGNASVKSIANIQAQSTALKALRDEAKIGGRAFNQLTKDIAKLDAQMGKAGKTTQGRRGGARQATQIAGAVISGGIFGGPEGALGAAGGAALGGVEGAFAGAAIGAQVGAFREALAASAEYAAEIGKLQIALQGVAGSQENYASALETAAQVTATLNVPQQEAVRGVTRLTAAVTGAGGPIRDAETTFRNVTAAIKATGGSTEDVQGAITAMVQVFSKGKVSAEELSGQLGERLPGAVTLFAEANKMTLPELQKNLKAGSVGLNELMAFIEELGVRYSGTALEIASSNAEAGARLTVVFDDMKAQVGAALLDTGAQFQDTFGEFIKDITPAMVEGAKIIAAAMSGLAKNLKPVLAALGTFVAIFAGGQLVLFIKGVVTATGLLGATAAASAGKVALLTAAMLSNPLFLGAAAVAGIVGGIVAITNALGAQRKELEGLAKAAEAPGADLKARQAGISALTSQIARERRIIRENQDRPGQGRAARSRKRREAQARLESLERRRTALTRVKPEGEDKPFEYKAPTVDAPSSAKTAKDTLPRRIKQAQDLEARMQRQLLIAQSQGEIGRVLAQQANQRSQLEQKIADLKKEGSSQELDRATASATQTLNASQQLELQKRINTLYSSAVGPLDKAVEAIKEKARSDKRYKDLLAKGINPQRAKDIINLEKLKQKALDRLDIEINILKAIVSQDGANKRAVETLDELLKKRKELEGRDPEEATEEGNYEKAKSEFEQFEESFKTGIEDMMNVGPKLAGVAVNAIGSMTDGLIELITTGKTNFKEMTAAILKDIAKIMMQAAIAGTVKKLFGLADGGVIQGGRLKPYAKGGVVSAPTVFPMAGGDVGLMGEAGPEAIMPLKRGNNGKLGVEVAGRSNAIDAMNRYSGRNNGGLAAGVGSTGDNAVAGAEATSAPIDVRYSVERINSVDYVTADQFQAGIKQAADRGAKEGEQKTLKRLQMSSGTRRRLGL